MCDALIHPTVLTAMNASYVPKAERLLISYENVFYRTLLDTGDWVQTELTLSGIRYCVHVQACPLVSCERSLWVKDELSCRVITISTVLPQEPDLSIRVRALQETRVSFDSILQYFFHCSTGFSSNKAAIK